MHEAIILHIDGIPVRYFRGGKGETLVLLHGFCLHSEIWEMIFPSLISDLDVILIDLPGHGGSGKFPGMHSIDEMAHWLNRVLRLIDVDEFSIAGHSLGGYVSIAYAERYPQKVKGLGMINSIADCDSPMKAENRTKTISFLRKHGAIPFLENFYPSLYHELVPQTLERYFEMSQAHPDMETLIAYTSAMRDRPDRRNVLKNADMPILFIVGGYDEYIPKIVIREEAALSKHGIWVFSERSGHLSMMEQPEDVIRGLKSLVDATIRFRE